MHEEDWKIDIDITRGERKKERLLLGKEKWKEEEWEQKLQCIFPHGC